ncbi:MAG: bifunctional tRNA (5-methylaminomethyl-2-thiouridine)(34)-methyltransferase MnmD/FAD-dependent 5-carboxymethylaminomethyl-2-thiouridine(34) oxidoreductase MnmC, partial [Pseudomonadota bacterium]
LEEFIIAETGFGFGLNFLNCAHKWLKNATKEQRLHYFSFEKHPVQHCHLTQCYETLSLESNISSLLLSQLPMPVRGFHRIHFYEQNIHLTLVYGDALNFLKQASFQADCWFLDGFSPSKNQELWSFETAKEIFRLTKNNGTFSTYSSASQVRNNFNLAGFTVSKRRGFEAKREMLTGKCENKKQQTEFHFKEKAWFNLTQNQCGDKKITIIGAGMAGVFTAAALAKRNWDVTIIDRQPRPAMEGSGNANAILMPRLSIDHDAQSQLTLAGYLYSVNFLNNLKRQAPELSWEQCGAIQIPRDDKQRQRMLEIISQEEIPEELLYSVDIERIKSLTNCTVSDQGWHIPLAGWTVPGQVCSYLLDRYKERIHFIANTHVNSISEANNIWSVYDKHNHLINTSSTLLIANAHSANQFQQTNWCETYPKRGQLTYLPESSSNIHPQKIICADAYLTPKVDTQYVLGATFITADTSKELRDNEHLDNLRKVKKIIPSFEYQYLEQIDGRVAIRSVSQDRLPIVGPVANVDDFQRQYSDVTSGATHIKYSDPKYYKGLYLSTAFGSRGLAWIPLCAETMACMINNEPLPISKYLISHIHPSRILIKKLMK